MRHRGSGDENGGSDCSASACSELVVFSAAHQSGRKVKTHEHLEALERADLSQLAKSEVLSAGLKAARDGTNSRPSPAPSTSTRCFFAPWVLSSRRRPKTEWRFVMCAAFAP